MTPDAYFYVKCKDYRRGPYTSYARAVHELGRKTECTRSHIIEGSPTPLPVGSLTEDPNSQED